MKNDEELDNSINCAIPVKNSEPSHSIMFEEEKRAGSINDDSSSFRYEGGEEIRHIEDSKDDSNKIVFQSNSNSSKRLSEPFHDNLFQT